MSRLDELLKEYRAALDTAHRGAAQSSDPLNDPATLDLLERMIIDCVKGLLEDLGEASETDESAEMMIARASAAVGEHRERFVEDAPIEFFSRQIEGINQVLRDIGYLREGFGLGSGRAKPADMRWSHGRAVESYMRDTMRQIAGEFRSDVGDVRRLIPEADLDLAATHRDIVELLKHNVGAGEFMDAAIDLGNRQTQVAGWDIFRDLPYEDELGERSSFFLDVITRQPPRAPLVGLYAEIAYPSRRGETVADLNLTGADSYQPDDEEWFARINYTPKDSYAQSDVLASIYRLAYAPGGLGNAADFTLCLAWAAYFSRACAGRYLSEVGSDYVGLRVGFSGGDWIDLGWVRPS